MTLPTLCAACRVRPVTPDRSVCETCYPRIMPASYQTVTLVFGDGRRVSYTGKPQIDQVNPPKVVEVIVSTSRPLPDGMTWDTLPVPVEGKDVCR